MSVQHVYSRESTGSFEVDSIVISLMNSKHAGGTIGLSAILEVSPMKAHVNARQFQDFLLFREIWVPSGIRESSFTRMPTPTPSSEPQAYIVQRYQQVAAAGAFPWNAVVSIKEITIQLDLGQSLGKSVFTITSFWASSKKTSEWEQNLCLGLGKVDLTSRGRMSGFVELQNLGVRTSIEWPQQQKAPNQIPLIQASLGFGELRVKASFDFQPFLIADISTFDFLMFNVRDAQQSKNDRLVGVLDGDKVQVFCTASSASQGLALYQAFQRLIMEKSVAYESSLREVDKYLQRKPSINIFAPDKVERPETPKDEDSSPISLQLHTNVVVSLRAVNLGAFPSTFFDNQIFKIEALNASARFSVVLDEGRIYSQLGMNLGQLRVALSNVSRPSSPKTLGEVSVDDVVACANSSKGGTILKVPELFATMQTWQTPGSNHIDYIFKSSFQGRVDVGWNYSRISFLRGMWNSHSRSLAQRLGKPVTQSAFQITTGPSLEDKDAIPGSSAGEEKITAVVNVPMSKYDYTALEPPVIETPQLRDMGEATPPLEWIGLQREKLPNLTHQIVIVSLLEVAREVEDAYSKILGSS